MQNQPSAIIVADGGIDLPAGYAARFGIRTVPLMVVFGNEALRSGTDISAGEFYTRLRVGREHPTTSQPSVGDYLALYEEAGKEGLPILSFHLSAGLSGSVASARLAQEMAPHLDIRIVDTGTLSAAMALQVLVAADMARQGIDPDQIIAETQRIGRDSDLYYTIDTLEYLRRGGRIGRVAGYVGSLLGIRPIITVDKATGTYVANGRARSFRQGISQIVEKVVEQVGEGGEVSCIIVHGDVPGDVARLLEQLHARTRVVWVEVVRANPSLGVHVGPDAIGLGFYPGALPVETLLPAETLVGD